MRVFTFGPLGFLAQPEGFYASTMVLSALYRFAVQAAYADGRALGGESLQNLVSPFGPLLRRLRPLWEPLQRPPQNIHKI